MDDVVVDRGGWWKSASVDSGAEGHRERKGRSMLLFQRERHIACEEKAHDLDDYLLVCLTPRRDYPPLAVADNA